jgi:RNB domain-containing protein
MSVPREQQRTLLLRVARRAMTEHGFEADFPDAAFAEVQGLTSPIVPYGAGVRDLRNLPWCSIDNDDSRDLDQFTVSEALAVGGARVLVAVADVSTAVTPGSALGRHAAANTTSSWAAASPSPARPAAWEVPSSSSGGRGAARSSRSRPHPHDRHPRGRRGGANARHTSVTVAATRQARWPRPPRLRMAALEKTQAVSPRAEKGREKLEKWPISCRISKA